MSESKEKILSMGIYLIMEPQYYAIDNSLSGFLLGVYNNTEDKLSIELEICFSESADEEHDLELEGNEWAEFSEFDLKQFHDTPQLNIDINWPEKHKSFNKKLKPKAKHVAHIPPMIVQLETAAYCIEIWKSVEKKQVAKQELRIDPELIREALLDNKSGNEIIDIEDCTEEMDIHADKMGLSSIDISTGALDYQLSAFEQGLDRAIANGLHSFLVIHGRGTGILRKEVHRRLKAHKQVRRFSLCNDSGATLIEI
ncbi:MAG: Smr/MutS family protein [Chitinophagales bacterium]